MAHGRRKESRLHACVQASLVWSIGEFDADVFVRTGAIEKPKPAVLDPELRMNVDKFIDSIVENGGQLIIPPEQANGR